MTQNTIKPPNSMTDQDLAEKKREILVRTVTELSRQTYLIPKGKASIRMINTLGNLYKNLTGGDELTQEDTEQLAKDILKVDIIKSVRRRKGKS